MTQVGPEIFQLITSGMYDNPLAIYREYVQNAADSIALSGSPERSVRIAINRPESSVTIFDNGPGLSREQAVEALVPLAQSQKPRTLSRGFRGIGRLAGLAFAESVTFLTRSHPDEPITRISWDGAKINQLAQNSALSWEAIRECVTIDTNTGLERPGRFFEAKIDGVGRHAAGQLLNEKVVRTYIGEVCPVPMRHDFSYACEIESIFEERQKPLALHIEIEGEPAPVTRPFGDTIWLSSDRKDRFNELERICIPSLRGDDAAAVGWLLHSSYLGAIPQKLGIRGIRARAGNIQVGDEKAFDHLFPEDRFNRWCVGEIHVLDPAIVPNARRDYFEPGPRLRNLENHLGAVCRRIADQCREASKARNRKRRLQALLGDVDDTRQLAESGYLSNEDARGLVAEALARVRQARTTLLNGKHQDAHRHSSLDAAEKRLSHVRVEDNENAYGGVAEAKIYKRIFGALTVASKSPGAAQETIEAVMRQVRTERTMVSKP